MIRPECPFRVRCSCCGFGSGFMYFESWEAADQWRRDVFPLSLPGHGRVGIIEANTDALG